MHFSTIAATTAFATTALAAPNAQFWWPRPQFSRLVQSTVSGTSDCAAPTATTTAYVTVTEHDQVTKPASSTTSATVIADPTGGSSTSTTVIVSPPTTTVVDASSSCAAQTATIIATYTAPGSTVTAPGSTVTAPGETLTVPGSTVILTVTETAPYLTKNETSPALPTGTPRKCITPQEAEELAEVFRQLIQDYSTGLALAALTEDFVDYSSAVNILMNKGAQYPKNITGPTFATRALFMAGQGSQPKIPFERLNTFWGCDSVSVRWWTSRSGNGQKTEAAMVPVVGNGIMHVVPSPEAIQTYNGVTYNWRIKELYSEFNAAAWLVNLGVFVPAGPVDYINKANATNTTTKRSVDDYEHFDASLRGAMI
ncbi:hypothetical protein LTR78_010526 [Recurvomyces mirabilis]|uniref:NTF2-like domain-containing protein n=1 Tax=Recurvomyces mirabilis TaxID=574656 RepID=A0AAE0TQA4_9PEZI|nr:hypothetical protein LTR78_010526 [Recurvomyces mirabilis]KAK5149606.1 hypothetical protein LTS14_010808 [Recurvomyces mirabilis]